MSNIAIYTRKSKFTGKGESIENQILKCKKFIEFKFSIDISTFPEENIFIDEDYSGRNENRPKFKEMKDKILSNEINHVIIYQLNRFGRNARDIHNSIALCEEHNCIIYSATEGFDTSTSFGKAVMGILASLAQLETEQLAERIKDNMYTLAKMGRWLGGQSPLGFDGTREYYVDENGKERSITKLKPNKDELKIVKLIFEKYLKEKSLFQVAKWALSNNLVGKKGANINKSAVNAILKNPVYVKSDSSVMKYLESNGYETCGEPNENGILRYGKDDCQIMAVSKHKGVIESSDWIAVQNLLKKNAEGAPRFGKTKVALLSGGLLKCKCGASMHLTHFTLKSGEKTFYYTCSMKNASGKTRCNSKNINGPLLDKNFIEFLKNYSEIDITNNIKKILKSSKRLDTKTTLDSINLQIDNLNKAIKKLVNKLKLIDDPEVSKILIDEIASEKEKIKELEINKSDLLNDQASKSISESNLVDILALIHNFKKNIDKLEFDEKKRILTEIIDHIVVDEDDFIVYFNIKKN